MAVFNLPVMILSDRTAPVISGTSVGNPIAIDENVAASSLVATMTDDGTAVSYAIVSGNTNGDFAIANNGDITVVNSPDYETTSTYSLGITATDAIGNTSAPFTVTININDLDEIPPVVTVASQPYLSVFENENSLTIASFTATDAGSDVTNSLTLSGTPNATNFSLVYNSSTQQMDLVTAASGLLGGGVTADQTFTLTASATDAAGNTGSAFVNLVVKNAEAPTITSGASTLTVQENSAAATGVLSTYAASGTTPITWSVTGTDANDFNINSSGELTFASNAGDFEVPTDSNTDNIYSATVNATNQFGFSTRNVAVTVTNDVGDDPNWWSFSGLPTNSPNDVPWAFTMVGNTAFWADRDLNSGVGPLQMHKATLTGSGHQTVSYTSSTMNSSVYDTPWLLLNRGGALYGLFSLQYTSGSRPWNWLQFNTSNLAVSNSYSHQFVQAAFAVGTNIYWADQNSFNSYDWYNGGSNGTGSTLIGATPNNQALMHGGAVIGSYAYFITQTSSTKDTLYRVSTSNLTAGQTTITLATWPGTTTYSSANNLGIGAYNGYLYIARRTASASFEVAKYNVDGSLAS